MRKFTISTIALILVLMSLPVFAPADVYIHPSQMGDQGGAIAAEIEMQQQQQMNAFTPYSQDVSSSSGLVTGRDNMYLLPGETPTTNFYSGVGAESTPQNSVESGGTSFETNPGATAPGTSGQTGYTVDPRFVIPGTSGESEIVGLDEETALGQTVTSGGVQTLDWFSGGADLLKNNKNITIYDTKTGTTWSAKYINGANHADVIPASKSDATLIKSKKITGSYERRPVVVTIAGTKYAGSMYAVGHGSTSYCTYFSGVMCIHFTGSKTHGTKKVDSAHQSAITEALSGGN